MASIQIPNLPVAISLTGAEEIEIVQAGVSCRTTTQNVVNLISPTVAALQLDVAELQDVQYGSYYDTTTQSHGAAGNEALVLCNTVDLQNGVSVVDGTKFTVSQSGIYNIQFSLQIVSPSNNKHAYFWLKKNGSAVSNSNTEVDLPNKDYGYVAAWNFFVSLNSGQYVQLAWTSDDSVTLKYNASPAYGPAIPSAIVTMNLIKRI